MQWDPLVYYGPVYGGVQQQIRRPDREGNSNNFSPRAFMSVLLEWLPPRDGCNGSLGSILAPILEFEKAPGGKLVEIYFYFHMYW